MPALAEPSQELIHLLEAQVDRSSLSHVLHALEIMCQEKADHVQTTWQDTPRAKSWRRDAAWVRSVIEKVEN